MPKGDACKSPVCRLCGEAHRIEAGLVCPKFRRAKPHPQPKLLALPPPPKPEKPAKVKPMKKAKKAKSKAKPKEYSGYDENMRQDAINSVVTVTAPAPVKSPSVSKKSKAAKRKEYLKLKARERRAANKAGLSVQDYRAKQATA